MVGSKVSIQYCYNTGTISGTGNAAGGILGNNPQGSQPFNIQSCYNIGEVSAGTDQAGGIVGFSGAVNLIQCYNATQLKLRGASVGGTNTNCAGKLGTSLKNYASNLGGDFREDRNNKNGGYPVLWWQ